MEIPLLVGEVRNCEDHSGDTCLVVDAVFNPWVVENAEANNTFKAQVIDLAVQWVEQEVRVKTYTFVCLFLLNIKSIL